MAGAVDREGVVAAVAALAGRALPRTAWVGIDGCGAAGKTSLAAAVQAAVPAVRVVHVDDFSGHWVLEWDWDRFQSEVAGPLLAGRRARYQCWDVHRGRGGQWAEVEPGGVVVVEGVSATRREVAVPWDLTVWVETPREVRLARARERDGEAMLARWLTDWMPSEEAYIAREHPAERVDLVVAGTD